MRGCVEGVLFASSASCRAALDGKRGKRGREVRNVSGRAWLWWRLWNVGV